MTPEYVIGFGRHAVEITLLVAAPMLGLGLLVGVMVSLFQAVTQIQEMTLTFVPKIVAVMVAIVVFSPWMIRMMVAFTARVLMDIPLYAK
ncbi:MAG: flagellar biosynthesis protein FliQ [Deltaproteobacteria bacterium]|nr:flagellar biosynthesis protein FliQ [Deltaproteobacteria bacterium]